MDLLKVAVKAAIDAGKSIMDIYNSGSFDVNTKSDNSPLTKADIASHSEIIRHLSVTQIPAISEEGKDIDYSIRSKWPILWMIDPLDGTKEFIKRNGEFTVNIALIESNIPVLGVVYAPVLKELFFAKKDFGAFKFSGDVENIEVENLIKFANKLPTLRSESIYRVVASRSHMTPETEEYIKDLDEKYGNVELVSIGSSLKLCMVAEGKADCYPRFAPTMEWDTAAGQAICMYAGKDVIDYNTNKTMKYNKESLLNNWFVVK